MTNVSMTVNGKSVSREVPDTTLLSDFLREHLRLTGTHVGCDTSQCGACVVHVDGRAVKSCTALAVALEGRRGHHDRGVGAGRTRCTRCRRPFNKHHGLQCGFCTPGMIMAGIDMVNRYQAEGRDADQARSATSWRAISAAAPATTTSSTPSRTPPARWPACPRPRNKGGTIMSDGIGARVARKEDKRFLTGKGKYTDDFRVENQAYAAFVRSPVAHAKITASTPRPRWRWRA
jgi:carbon-monoxide dehydrogenase small subunit